MADKGLRIISPALFARVIPFCGTRGEAVPNFQPASLEIKKTAPGPDRPGASDSRIAVQGENRFREILVIGLINV